MLTAVMVFATALACAWLTLLGSVTREDWIAAAYNKVLDNNLALDKLRMEDAAKRERQSRYRGAAALLTRMFPGGGDKKKTKLERLNEQLRNGRLGGINLFDMPGYALQRRLIPIRRSALHGMLISKCSELYGRKHAANKAAQLTARMLSYPIIGVAVSLALGVIVTGAGAAAAGTAILVVGSLLVFVLVYALYDELRDRVQKRRAAISRQFPNVVSKLALLVTSGMIMDMAWKETACSQEAELYWEMRKTAEELDNLLSPQQAYGNFIGRCNTKETGKLASAIMQNLSKGNAEIGKLLKDMAKEAWQERRHTARRDSEKANSRLMIPTMLLFIAVLVMLLAPVAVNFSNL